MADNALTATEKRQYQYHNQLIAKGASDIYNSLRVQHDKRLYREEYETFEDYCRGQWGMSPQHARNLIKHGQILRIVEDSADPKEKQIVSKIRESHTREVADLPPEEAAKIIVETVKKTDGKITASAVRETRSGESPDPFGKGEDFDPFEEPSPGEECAGGHDAPEDSSPRPPRNGKDKSGGSKQRTPAEEFALQRSKCCKTIEAAMREVDALNRLKRRPEWHDTSIAECKSVLIKAREW
jgi:hypothetical protein